MMMLELDRATTFAIVPVSAITKSTPQHVAQNSKSSNFSTHSLVSSPFIHFVVTPNSFVVMKILLGTLALLIGFSNAACPNQCSGHGTCGVDEVVSRK